MTMIEKNNDPTTDEADEGLVQALRDTTARSPEQFLAFADPSMGGFTQDDLDDETARRVVAARTAMEILLTGRGKKISSPLTSTAQEAISVDDVIVLARFIHYGD